MIESLIGILQSIPAVGAFAGLLVGVAIVVALVYVFFGPATGMVVMLGCLAILVLLAIIGGIVAWRRSRRQAGFERGMDAQLKGGARGQVRDIRDRWAKAMVELRKAKLNMYSLPWYLLIGEPGSGKTTTLRQSGLEFPVGTEALSGTSGTRNCDWWFTNDAVILDTAGRWTFNETNAPDRAEWDEFLALLKKNRRNCPINGVLVGVPCDSLLRQDPAGRRQAAQILRDKLTHLQRYLEVQFPVYFLVTKADRILGFSEFFGRLPAGEDRQLVGWSNPDPLEKGYNPKEFPQHFRALYERVHQYRMRMAGEIAENAADRFDGAVRLAGVTDPLDTLYVFPEEFAACGEALGEYIDIIFSENRFRESLFFRGFYFTSGLQQGQPILKACKELLRGSAAGEEAIEDLAKIFGRSRSMFIHEFYRKKVFPEKGLVARSSTAVSRERTIRYAFYGGGGLLAAGMVAAMLFFAADINRKLDPIRTDLAEAKTWIDKDSKEKPARKPDEIAAHLNTQLRDIESGELTGGGSTLFIPTHSLPDVVKPVGEAHRGFWSWHVLEPFLRGPEGVEQQLAKGALVADRDDPSFRGAFVNALVEYVRWWRGALENEPYFASSGAESLEPFVRYSALAGNLGDAGREALKDRLIPSYKALLADKDAPYSPRPVLRGLQTRNITAAVDKLRDHWERQADKLRLKVPGLEHPERIRVEKLTALLDSERRLLDLETTKVPLRTTEQYKVFDAQWRERYDKWSESYQAFTTAEDTYRTALEEHRGKLGPVGDRPGRLATVREGVEGDYRALLGALDGKSLELSLVRDQAQRDRAGLAALLSTIAAPLTGGAAGADAKVAFRISLGALKDAGVPADVLKKLEPADRAGFATESELEDRLSKLLTGGELIRHGAVILKHSKASDKPPPSSGGAPASAGAVKNYSGEDYGRVAAALHAADFYIRSPSGDPEDASRIPGRTYMFVLPGKGWRLTQKNRWDAFDGVLGRLNGADGKPDKALDPLGRQEVASLLVKLRLAKLQSMATRAAVAFLERIDDPKAAPAWETPVEAVLEKGKLQPLRTFHVADRRKPEVRIEPRLTRPFRAALEEYLGIVEEFAKSYGDGTPVPMLDADRSSLLLERRARQKLNEYRTEYVRFWKGLYERIERELPERTAAIKDWNEFRLLAESHFGFSDVQGGLASNLHTLVSICAGNLDAEQDKAWLPDVDPETFKYLERYGAAEWMKSFDETSPAYRAFRQTVMDLPGDAVDACRRLADKDKGPELLRPIRVPTLLRDRHEHSRPLRAFESLSARCRELLADDANRRFNEDWSGLMKRAYGAGGWCVKFPFAADPGAPDAVDRDAQELLGRDSDVGRVLDRFAPLLETERLTGFPYVIKPDDRDRKFVSAWREWREFLYDEKDLTVLRKFEAVKLVVLESADVSKFAPNSFLKQITRLRITVGGQPELRYDTSVPEKREFAVPFVPHQDFGQFEVKYDSENADLKNARQTVWPPPTAGGVARRPGAWVMLRYLREAGPTRTRTDDQRTWFVYHVMKDNAENKSFAFRLDLIFPARVPGPFPDRRP